MPVGSCWCEFSLIIKLGLPRKTKIRWDSVFTDVSRGAPEAPREAVLSREHEFNRDTKRSRTGYYQQYRTIVVALINLIGGHGNAVIKGLSIKRLCSWGRGALVCLPTVAHRVDGNYRVRP